MSDYGIIIGLKKKERKALEEIGRLRAENKVLRRIILKLKKSEKLNKEENETVKNIKE